jgi:hypothetical protein
MICGHKIYKDLHAVNKSVTATSFTTVYKTVQLYTAYLGQVSVRVGETKDINKVLMECKGVGSASDIIIRELDAEVSRIDPNANPSLRALASKPPAVVDIAENKESFYQLQHAELQKAFESNNQTGITQHQKALDKFNIMEPVLSNQFAKKYDNVKFTDEQLRTLYVKCCVVDIHFNTSCYLDFLQEKLNRPSINNEKLLISVYNVRNLDNAFFTGEYMIYGNGDNMFYPLSCIDVTGHELGHGLVQATAGLNYEGHSGALNESFADVLGTAFEFWLYNKFNEDVDPNDDILGDADWLVGEDIGATVKYLRNMRDPDKAEMPQPAIYRGQYWADPNNMSNDEGGVHINSGISNRCFTLLSDAITINTSLSIFYSCLLKLHPGSDFIDFRNTLLSETPENLRDQTRKCLDTVGLTSNAFSDWNKSPPQNRQPPQLPRNPQFPRQPPQFPRQPRQNPQFPRRLLDDDSNVELPVELPVDDDSAVLLLQIYHNVGNIPTPNINQKRIHDDSKPELTFTIRQSKRRRIEYNLTS